jgi:hypothetical protein
MEVKHGFCLIELFGWLRGPAERLINMKQHAASLTLALHSTILPPVFRIRDILIRIRILEFVHWITDPDPDPALSSVAFKMATRHKVFSKFFFYLFVGIFTSSFKDNKSLRSHKIEEIMLFLNFLAC